jgi:Zn-dependent protease
MALPVPEAGGNGLLSFRLLGFPVSIHTSFLVIVLVMGYTANPDLASAVVWLVVVTLSVLAHELGHAIVAAPAGGQPRIDLYMMAGLTTWQPGRASRGRRVAVSLSGVAAGVALGLGLLALFFAVDPVQGSLLEAALIGAVLVNLGWGLLNLLPMLPLDGGQVVLALIPGADDLVRLRRTSYVSVVVAAAVALGAFAVGEWPAAALVLFFGAGNVQRVLALRQGAGQTTRAYAIDAADAAIQAGDPEEALRRLPDDVPEEWRPYAATVRAVALLRLGRAREAQDVLIDLPHGAVDPVLEATVLWANGQEQLARERLVPALQQDPAPWAVRELVLFLRSRQEDVVAVVGDVTGRGATGVLDALYQTGDYAPAAAWGERALATGAADAFVAYNAACAYGRAGDQERSLRMLGYAASLGWDDLAQADDDPDLAAARALPAWPEVRAAFARNAGSRAPHAAR